MKYLNMNSLMSIQILRAVAAWLVVFSHYIQVLHPREFYRYAWVGQIGVDIFFIISGFIMFYSLSNKMCGAKEFIVKRLIRIVPVYWFFTFLMVLLRLIYAKEFSYTDWNLHSLITSLVFMSSKNPSGIIGYFPLLPVGWTLNYEMFFYALLSLCILSFGRFCFLACTLTLVALPLVWKMEWIYGVLMSEKWMYAFACGIVLGYAYVRLKDVRPRLLYVLGVAMFIIGVVMFASGLVSVKLYAGKPNEIRFLFVFLLIGSALGFESVLSNTRAIGLRWLRYLGDISYSTYLSHTLVLGVSLHYVWRPGSVYEELFLLLMTSSIIFAISHFSYQYIEAGPLLKILKRKLVGRVSGLPT